MNVAVEEEIGLVDTALLHQFNWLIQRVFARRAVHQIELHRYVRDMLATGRWESIRLVPVRDAEGRPSDHVFAVYGRPRRPAGSAVTARACSGAHRLGFVAPPRA